MSEPGELTREQVEEYGRNLSCAQFHTTATFLLAHDATLRAERDALKEQLAEVTQNYESAIHGRSQFRTALGVEREAKDVCLKQVADLTHKLAEANETMSGAWESMGNMSKRVEELKGQLAASEQARVKLREALVFAVSYMERAHNKPAIECASKALKEPS